MELGNILVLGIAIFGGLVGASLFKKLHIPEVVGFIVIGLLLGQSGFKVVSADELVSFQPLISLALGIIGFLVGSELKAETFKKYGKKFSAILLGEGLISFLFVTGVTFFIFYSYLHDFNSSLAGAVVLGAIASATDPASTLSVLWEYRTLGIFTTSLIAIVALDDALAMTLYGLGSGTANILAGSSGSFLPQMGNVVFELLLALAIGAVAAIILAKIIRKISDPDKLLAFAVGILLLVVGIAVHSNLDIILMTMSFGCLLTNYSPRRSEPLVELVRRFSNPIYILFFVLAGARLVIGQMPLSIWIVVVAYILARTLGKMLGAFIGASISGSEPVVKRYLGLGLFTQGGVAIGLSIMASHNLSGIPLGDMSLGDAVISVVAATTFIVQLIGPPMVKYAAKLAGEVGRDVKPEDVIDSWKVIDVMDSSFLTLNEGMVISSALEAIAESDGFSFPVVSSSGELLGILALDNMKKILPNDSSWSWLLVSDVMQPPEDITDSSVSLREALQKLEKFNLSELVVTETRKGAPVPVGILNKNKVMLKVEAETLERRAPVVQKPKKRPSPPPDHSDVDEEYLKIHLGDVRVADVRSLLVRDASVVDEAASIEELLQAFLQDTRIRYVYVTKKGKLIGSVRLNSIVRYLFPYDAVLSGMSEAFIGDYMQFDVDKISEIMEPNPAYVTEKTRLREVASILLRDKMNELPVIDDEMHIIGQINVYEIIARYLSSLG